jgi:hypothetical protein
LKPSTAGHRLCRWKDRDDNGARRGNNVGLGSFAIDAFAAGVASDRNSLKAD